LVFGIVFVSRASERNVVKLQSYMRLIYCIMLLTSYICCIFDVQDRCSW